MDGLQEAHNGYLEVYLNLGFIGAGLIIGMILVGYRHVIAALRQDPRIGSLRLAYFVVAIIFSLSEAGFRETTLTWFFFLLAITAIPETPAPDIGSTLTTDPSTRFAGRSDLSKRGNPVQAAVQPAAREPIGAPWMPTQRFSRCTERNKRID
jgi:O-antigen ligase